MRRQGALTGLAIVLAAMLAGCTDDPVAPPSASPTTNATASSMPSPEPTPVASPTKDAFDASVPPPVPGALSGPPSKEAAGEVAAYFMALFPYIQATGDLDGWEALSGRQCDYCASAAAIVKDLVASDTVGVGGQVAVTDAQVSTHRTDEYAVRLNLTQAPSQTVDSQGKVVEDFPDTLRVVADMLVVWTGDGWLVDSVVVDVHGRN